SLVRAQQEEPLLETQSLTGFFFICIWDFASHFANIPPHLTDRFHLFFFISRQKFNPTHTFTLTSYQ
ncbi:hypothetical protein, partial [Vibrio cholerae]